MKELAETLRAFAREREWERFHSPRNLAMALSVEAAEVVELFQWLTEEQSARLSEDQHAALADEIADVLIYLVRLVDVCGIDPMEAARRKVARNALRYPASRCRGRADKFTAYLAPDAPSGLDPRGQNL
jgi:NTP pyrophosphatase (non-canonical NTP hydrolase)